MEDAVMQDFQCNAFARKDSMPYLEYSAMLSLGERVTDRVMFTWVL